MTLNFLINFSGGLISPIITVSSYISFLEHDDSRLWGWIPAADCRLRTREVRHCLGTGTEQARRYAVVILLFLAAFLTPTPDAFTMLMMFLPLYALYEISILIVWLTGKKKAVTAD